MVRLLDVLGKVVMGVEALPAALILALVLLNKINKYYNIKY